MKKYQRWDRENCLWHSIIERGGGEGSRRMGKDDSAKKMMIALIFHARGVWAIIFGGARYHTACGRHKLPMRIVPCEKRFRVTQDLIATTKLYLLNTSCVHLVIDSTSMCRDVGFPEVSWRKYKIWGYDRIMLPQWTNLTQIEVNQSENRRAKFIHSSPWQMGVSFHKANNRLEATQASCTRNVITLL